MKFRLTIIITFISLFMGIIMMVFLAMFYQGRVENELKTRAIIGARMMSSLLDGKLIDHYLSTLEKDEFYHFLLEQLRKMQRESNIAFIVVTRV